MSTDVYALPEEHEDFRATIRQLAQEKIAPRAAEIDATDEYPWDIRRLLAEQDILALPFGEEHGGTGTGTLMLQVAVEELAKLSVIAFKELINPELKKAYAAARGKFVDVTAATGAYGPLEETTTHPVYGVIPVPVAKACEYSYYCEVRDIHARTSGYRAIAKLIVKTLPRR